MCLPFAHCLLCRVTTGWPLVPADWDQQAPRGPGLPPARGIKYLIPLGRQGVEGAAQDARVAVCRLTAAVCGLTAAAHAGDPGFPVCGGRDVDVGADGLPGHHHALRLRAPGLLHERQIPPGYQFRCTLAAAPQASVPSLSCNERRTKPGCSAAWTVSPLAGSSGTHQPCLASIPASNQLLLLLLLPLLTDCFKKMPSCTLQ